IRYCSLYFFICIYTAIIAKLKLTNLVFNMKIEILCSTMHGKVPLSIDKGFNQEKMIIVNQCAEDSDCNNSYLNFFERGISKSRNRAISNASADICLITDNDVYFDKNILRTIQKSFDDYPEADILTFQIETPEGDRFKNYKKDFFWHNNLSVAKVSSVEIAFRRKSIIEKNLKFDENFGLGSMFPTGEEYIFLSDALKSGLKIGYIPEVIAYHPKESSGGDFKNLSLIEAKGAMIRRVFGFKGIIVCLFFSLKKYKSSNMGFNTFFKIMVNGYLKSCKL
uniref:glycosyltransferase family A protein n=1 Tax=Acinetobacter indicus TaxID=756892 RepID=UPI000CEC6FFE